MKNKSRSLKIFLFFTVLLLVIAGAISLAKYWQKVVTYTDSTSFGHDIYTWLYGSKNRKVILEQNLARPDLPFFVLFLMGFFVLNIFYYDHFDEEKNPIFANLINGRARYSCLILYILSLFYCVFIFFLNFEFAIITLGLFLGPMILFKMEKISKELMIFLSLVSIIFGYCLVKATAAFILLLPTLHIIALRTKNAISSRYVAEEKRVVTKLSESQMKNVNTGLDNLKKLDWWDDIIEPEIEELLNALGSIANKGSAIEKEPSDNINSLLPYGKLSVRKSLVAAQDPTDIMLGIEGIKKLDKNFSVDEFIEKFKRIFDSVCKAHSEQDLTAIQPVLSDSLFEQLQQKINEEKNAGIRYQCTFCDIASADIIRVINKFDFEEIHILVNAMIAETAIDLVKNVPLNNEPPAPAKVSEVYTFVRRPSAKTLQKPGLFEGNCPNCGAPIEIGQVTVCKSCGSYIRSGSYDWVLSKITQTCEWKYSNPEIIPGWKELSELDTNLCIQQIEDKTSVIFWMLKNLELSRNPEAMQRFATAKYYQEISQEIKKSKDYINCENISLASMNLQAIDIRAFYVDIYLLAVWSGIPVKYDEKGRIASPHRFTKPFKNILVLTRKRGVVTRREVSLSGAHCPNCGGPLKSNFDIKCSYCNTVLNDGSEWILQKIIDEDSEEYNKLMIERNNLINRIVDEKTKNKFKGEYVDPASAAELLAAACRLLLADGVYDDKEIDFLKKLGEQLNVDETKVLGILETTKYGRGPRISLKGKTMKEKNRLLVVALEMAFADGVVSPEEHELILKLGDSIGYSYREIENCIKHLADKQRNQ